MSNLFVFTISRYSYDVWTSVGTKIERFDFRAKLEHGFDRSPWTIGSAYREKKGPSTGRK